MQIRLEFSPEQSLRGLCALRACTILGLLIAIPLLHYGLGLTPALTPMTSIITGLTFWTLISFWRLSRHWAVTQPEIFAQLSVDSLVLTALFDLFGGAGNPFVSFYLVPIAIAAVMLARSWAWGVTGVCIVLYTWLMRDFTQHLSHVMASGGFPLHVLGMWLNFLLSAVLVTVFVTTVAEAVRRRDRSLATAREAQLRNEQIIAIGTLAAATAHELSTPLSTMAITVGELRAQHRQDTDLLAELDLLREQINLCRQQLDTLLSSADPQRTESLPAKALRDFLQELLERWRLMRPEIQCAVIETTPFTNLEVQPEPGVAQVILVALNNAADASRAAGQAKINVCYSSNDQELGIDIRDYGQGLSTQQMAQAGRAVFSSKPEGYGLGLLLSHATLERLGGEMRLEANGNQGGTLTRIRLPLARLVHVGASA